MSAFRTAIYAIWVVFWLYWLVSAADAKRGSRPMWTRSPGLLVVVLAVVLTRVFKLSNAVVTHSDLLLALGAAMLLAGLAFAVWARRFLGANWGMPMTRKDEPELVTSGPYRFVRHPIYSGILLALLGSGLAISALWLIIAAVLGAYFLYSATVEEKLMNAAFPTDYPRYRERTKMIVPFLL